MPRRMLVVYRVDEPKPLLKLEVLSADMQHPGWMRFELQAGAPDWEEPTICWYRVPQEASVELQSEVTDADVMARAAEQAADDALMAAMEDRLEHEAEEDDRG